MSNANPNEPRNHDRGWRTFGVVLAVIFAIVGLAAVAFVVLLMISFNSWGNNK